MPDLTDAEIAELERLEREATRPPWHVHDLGERHFLETNHRYGIGSEKSQTYHIAKVEGLGDEYKANADLIAVLRNAAPAILAAARERQRLAGVVEGLERRLAAMATHDGAFVTVQDVLAELRRLKGGADAR